MDSLTLWADPPPPPPVPRSGDRSLSPHHVHAPLLSPDGEGLALGDLIGERDGFTPTIERFDYLITSVAATNLQTYYNITRGTSIIAIVDDAFAIVDVFIIALN